MIFHSKMVADSLVGPEKERRNCQNCHYYKNLFFHKNCVTIKRFESIMDLKLSRNHNYEYGNQESMHNCNHMYIIFKFQNGNHVFIFMSRNGNYGFCVHHVHGPKRRLSVHHVKVRNGNHMDIVAIQTLAWTFVFNSGHILKVPL